MVPIRGRPAAPEPRGARILASGRLTRGQGDQGGTTCATPNRAMTPRVPIGWFSPAPDPLCLPYPRGGYGSQLRAVQAYGMGTTSVCRAAPAGASSPAKGHWSGHQNRVLPQGAACMDRLSF